MAGICGANCSAFAQHFGAAQASCYLAILSYVDIGLRTPSFGGLGFLTGLFSLAF
jgi:hypothetical protein